jgi:hypothetical protein
VFDGAVRIVRSFFRNHFAHCRGGRCTGTPNPSHREKVICLVCEFFHSLEGHFQARFHLRDFIGKCLEFTSVFIMHVRHEDTEFVFR